MTYEPDYSRTQIHFLTQPPEWLPHLETVGRPRLILDLGSGGGRNSTYLQRKFPGARVVAIDLSFIRSVSCRQATGADVVCGDAMRLPFPDEAFDMILSTQVIEHVPDDRAFVREAGRILRKEGRMLISSVLRLPHGWYFYRHGGPMGAGSDACARVPEPRAISGPVRRRIPPRAFRRRAHPFLPAHFVYRLLARIGLVRKPDPAFFSKSALAALSNGGASQCPGTGP